MKRHDWLVALSFKISIRDTANENNSCSHDLVTGEMLRRRLNKASRDGNSVFGGLGLCYAGEVNTEAFYHNRLVTISESPQLMTHF